MVAPVVAPHAMMILTIFNISTIAQTTATILTMAKSHLDG
jgi:hypothetical protein